MKRMIILLSLFTLAGCENVEGQYKHDKRHHNQKDQMNDQLKQIQQENTQQS